MYLISNAQNSFYTKPHASQYLHTLPKSTCLSNVVYFLKIKNYRRL